MRVLWARVRKGTSVRDGSNFKGMAENWYLWVLGWCGLTNDFKGLTCWWVILAGKTCTAGSLELSFWIEASWQTKHPNCDPGRFCLWKRWEYQKHTPTIGRLRTGGHINHSSTSNIHLLLLVLCPFPVSWVYVALPGFGGFSWPPFVVTVETAYTEGA